VTRTKSVSFFGTLAIATLLVASSAALARDGQRQRTAHAPRATQPHTRTTERQRTENGHTRSDTWTDASGKTATRDAVVTNDREAGTRTRNVDYTGPNGGTASVDSVRTKTDDGFTRSTTATNKDGETATRDLTVSRDKEAGTVTRESNYTTFDGGEGSKSDVIQRTENGFTRETTRTPPNGEVHSRTVDVSCDKDVGKCVKQVGVDQQP
jgi:cytoskeletal protein RodZ